MDDDYLRRPHVSKHPYGPEYSSDEDTRPARVRHRSQIRVAAEEAPSRQDQNRFQPTEPMPLVPSTAPDDDAPDCDKLEKDAARLYRSIMGKLATMDEDSALIGDGGNRRVIIIDSDLVVVYIEGREEYATVLFRLADATVIPKGDPRIPQEVKKDEYKRFLLGAASVDSENKVIIYGVAAGWKEANLAETRDYVARLILIDIPPQARSIPSIPLRDAIELSRFGAPMRAQLQQCYENVYVRDVRRGMRRQRIRDVYSFIFYAKSAEVLIARHEQRLARPQR